MQILCNVSNWTFNLCTLATKKLHITPAGSIIHFATVDLRAQRVPKIFALKINTSDAAWKL